MIHNDLEKLLCWLVANEKLRRSQEPVLSATTVTTTTTTTTPKQAETRTE
jgi:hypothetical protein